MNDVIASLDSLLNSELYLGGLLGGTLYINVFHCQKVARPNVYFCTYSVYQSR